MLAASWVRGIWSYGNELLGPLGHNVGHFGARHFLGDSVRANL